MINPMQLMQMMHNSGNPQQSLINILQKQAGNNPVIKNALKLMKDGEMSELKNWQEICVRNGILIQIKHCLNLKSNLDLSSVDVRLSGKPRILLNLQIY